MRDVSAFNMGAPPGTLTSLPNGGGTDAGIRATTKSAATLEKGKADSSVGSPVNVDESEGRRVMNDAAILLGAMVAVLWVLGGIVFKNARIG